MPERVLAVEVDHDIIPFLKVNTAAFSNLEIVEGDIRKQNLRELCAPLGENFLVIANIPYNITTPIFEALWESGLSIRQISVMIQKEVAEKLMAAPSTAAYGLMKREVPVLLHSPAGMHRPCGKIYPAAQGGRRIRSFRDPAGAALRKCKTSGGCSVCCGPGSTCAARPCPTPCEASWSLMRWRAAMEQAEISPTARAEELSVDDWHP